MKLITYIKKLIKKQILLNKYYPSHKKRRNTYDLLIMFKDDLDFRLYIIHDAACETRCYRRIKNLK